MRKWKKLEAGNVLSASELNRLANEAIRMLNMQVEPPLALTNAGYNPTLRLVDGSLIARITSVGSSSSSSSSSSGTPIIKPVPYGWEELHANENGYFSVLFGGRTGTPENNMAYERNNHPVAIGTVIKLKPGLATEYLFSSCCGGGVVPASSASGYSYICCPGVTLPSVLYATITGGCDKTVTLNRNVFGGYQSDVEALGTCSPSNTQYSFYFDCQGGGFFTLYVDWEGGLYLGGMATGYIVDCSIPMWTFQTSDNNVCGCGGGAMTITVTT